MYNSWSYTGVFTQRPVRDVVQIKNRCFSRVVRALCTITNYFTQLLQSQTLVNYLNMGESFVYLFPYKFISLQ